MALSNEDETLVGDYVEKHGIGIRVAAGSDGNGVYGVRGIPAACLIDASGKVAWSGHPNSLSSGKVKAALKGAKKAGKGAFLSMNLDSEYEGKLKKVAKDAGNGALGKALTSLRKLIGDEKFEEKESAQALELQITDFIAMLQAQGDTFLGNMEVMTAQEIYSALADSLKGQAEAEAAKAGLAKIEESEVYQDELKAAELLAKAYAEVERRGTKKAVKKFESVVKKYPNTKAGKRASKFLESSSGH